MSFNLTAIRKAIKAQLTEQLAREVNVDTENEGLDVPLVRFEVTSSPDYWGSFGPNGACMVRGRFTVVADGDDQSSTIRLDDFMSAGVGNDSSLIDAIYVDPTFGGVIETLTVEPGVYSESDGTAELLVELVCRKQGAEA